MMKNVKNYLLIAAITIIAGTGGFLWGKNHGKGFNEIKWPPPTSLDCEKNILSEECAQQWVKNYGIWAGCMAKIAKIKLDHKSEIKYDSVISSWAIPISDIVNLLGPYDAEKQGTISAYLAFKSIPSEDGNVNLEKDLLKQIGLGMTKAHLILTNPSVTQKKYYDLIEPCPSMCKDTGNSVLFPFYSDGFNQGYNLEK